MDIALHREVAESSCTVGGWLPDRKREGHATRGVISPMLANIFLHHVFDEWMRVKHSSVLFARYADDIIVHCRTKAQARFMLKTIEIRLARCKLKLHPEKTKIVYCKD